MQKDNSHPQRNIIISFIIVNYKGRNDTFRLLESIDYHFIKHVNIKNYAIKSEVIVVDNDSGSDLKLIKEKYPWIVGIQSPVNLGFAAGNNIGLKYSHGEYIFFVNNDAQLRDDSLIYLIERVSSSKTIAGASPKIIFAGKGRVIQYAGYTPLSKITMRNETIGLNEIDIGKYDTAHSVPYIHGAAFLIKREVIDKIGGWPENYFLYYEELDWSERIREAGYELWYEPKCVIYHSGSASIGMNSPIQVFYMVRNRLIFAKRNFSKCNAFLSVVYQLCIAVPKQCAIFAFKGKFNLVAVAVKACCCMHKEGKVNF